ncbi:MAG TPA: tRNA (N(6)-L-threonylcarbamoyladenosine(37)-C(2))-methylthiotransferase MtaB [Anaerolineaceae bacterium]|nr:tRNA (N(6)-L-threonylcarbamoyladenosine(37)-C(2))-methylthiotransferase MtaB [Anaerolineaceae bacterium]
MEVYLGSIGCRLNQSELEMMAADLRKAGHVIVGSPEKAQAAIINSCCVTAAAEADSRKLLHRLERMGVQKIFLTGCWVSPQGAVKESLPDGTIVIPNTQKHALVKQFFPNDTGVAKSITPRVALPGRGRRTRAFIKVQEGCDYHCTFCITRIARGKSVSRPYEEILLNIQAAELANVKEIVLTGTQLGGWGRDIGGENTIASLVKSILRDTDIPLVRLSSLEPWDIQDDFYPLLTENRFCAHLHLPLQSGSESILQRMGRKMALKDFGNLVQGLRKANPLLALTTDIVVGFPGETEQEFNESLEFVRWIQFSGGHVFRFSPRPGTPAASYPDQVDGLQKRERNRKMRAVLRDSAALYRERFIDHTVSVVWERGKLREDGTWLMSGLSKNYLRVQAISEMDRWNTISSVKLMEDKSKYMVGLILTDHRK